MRRVLKFLIIILLVVFVAIQFFQPEKNSGELSTSHIFQTEQIPEDVMNSLKNACMDCHSNQTNYLWYHKLSPVSWMISKHVTEGKKELNFSEWGEQDAYDKFGAFEDISKEVERKTMPIKSYTFMHRNARFSDEERTAFVEWCKKRSAELTEELKQ